MDSRWCKIKRHFAKKRYSLLSLGAGSIFFSLLYLITKYLPVRLCVLYNLWGRTCMGCGLSRGMLCALRGDLAGATAHHPLSVPLLVGILVYLTAHAVDLFFDTAWARRLDTLLANKWLYPLYAVLWIVAAVC